MPLDEKQRQIVLNALLVMGEMRVRASDAVNELTKQAIRMRDIELRLELAYDDLSKLIRKGEPQS